MSERERQSWRCPRGCTWPECLHLQAERVRLVLAEWNAAVSVVDAAREVPALAPVVAAFDAAVAAQRVGP